MLDGFRCGEAAPRSLELLSQWGQGQGSDGSICDAGWLRVALVSGVVVGGMGVSCNLVKGLHRERAKLHNYGYLKRKQY